MTGQRETLSHAAHSLLERAGNGLAGTDASWGGHFINAAESIDVIDSGHSPVLSPKVDVKIDLECPGLPGQFSVEINKLAKLSVAS